MRYAKIAAAVLLGTQALLAVNPNHSYSDRKAPSTKAPVDNPPMLIVLGSDDNYNIEGMEWITESIAERRHADSTRLRMSFYCNTEWDYQLGLNGLFETFQKAYALGNEVSSHTASHIKCSAPDGSSDRLSDTVIYDEMIRNIDSLAALGIKKEHMFGFRTPQLAVTDSTFTAVQRVGFDYDCSIYDAGLTFTAGEYHWPYTLDTKNSFRINEDGLEKPSDWSQGIEPIEPSYAPGNHLSFSNNNATNRAPVRRHSGLWELPVYLLTAPQNLHAVIDKHFGYQAGGLVGGSFEDLIQGDTSNTVPRKYYGAALTKEQGLEVLKHHFEKVYKGNRSPMTILLHSNNFSPTTGNDEMFPQCSKAEDRQWLVEQFMNYALSKKEVWFVSGEQAIKYCQNPVSADQFNPDDYTAIPVTDTTTYEIIDIPIDTSDGSAGDTLFAPFKVDPATRDFAKRGMNVAPILFTTSLSDLEKIDFSQFEIVYYSFYTVDGSGKPVRELNKPLLKRMVEKAHAVGTKVVVGFAGGSGGTFDPDPLMDTLCSDTGRVKEFVSDLMDIMRLYDVDGIDNDWEPFIDPAGKKEKYEHLMEVLRDSVDALTESEKRAFEKESRGEVAFVPKVLSAAVIAQPWAADLYLSERSIELMDYVIPMTYFFEKDTKKAFNENIDYWLNTKKVPAEKLIPCVALFGQDAYSSEWHPQMKSYGFKEILAKDPEAHLKNSIIMNEKPVYYYGHELLGDIIEILWNRCAGSAVWALYHDTEGEKSMLGALHKKRVELLESTPVTGTLEKQSNRFSMSVQNMSLHFSKPVTEVSILSVNGRVVERQNLTSSTMNLPSGIAKGVYFVKAVSVSGQALTRKIAVK